MIFLDVLRDISKGSNHQKSHHFCIKIKSYEKIGERMCVDKLNGI
jgi:hypothetical protein